MVVYFPDDSPIDGDHMVNPGRSPSPQSVVPCLCRAQPRRRLPATIRRRGAIRRQFQRGKPHHLTGKSTTFLWGENISCNGKKPTHTHFFGGKHTSCAMFNYDPFAYPSDCYPNFQIITVTKIEKLQFSTDYCGIVVCFSVFFFGFL